MTTQSVAPIDTKTEQGIATRSASASDNAIIRTPDAFRDRLKIWQDERYHVLTPVANFSAMPANYGLVPTMVRLDPNPDAGGPGDVYKNPIFTKGEEVAIAKIGLAKLAQAAGMTIKTERTDHRDIPYYWEVRATVRFIGLDGTPQELDSTEELDLRDGSPRLKGFTDGQVMAFRSKGLRHCESRAINAAIRQFGIKQKYTRDELKKPFVIVRVVFTPDMTDAATRQQVTDRALAGTTSLYPSLMAATAKPAPEPLDVIGVGGRSPEEVETRPTAPTGRLVEDVRYDLEAGLFDVRLDGGEIVTTTSQDLGRQLNTAKKDARRVFITTDDAGQIKTVDAGTEAKY